MSHSARYRMHALVRLLVCSAVLIFLSAQVVSVPVAYAATITVQSSADDGTANAANCPGTSCRLRDAIAKAASTDTINFAGDYTINLASSQLTINKSLTIDGTGHTIVLNGPGSYSGSCGPCYPVFSIVAGTTVKLLNLTVANGAVTGNGGGIENLGTLYVTNSTISGNFAQSNGGGIFNNGGTVYVTNSTISGNQSKFHGGGIQNGFVQWGSDLYVVNSTISGNTATSEGGGIYNTPDYSPSEKMNVTLKNTIVANNTSATNQNCANHATLTDGGGNLVWGDTTCPGTNADPKLNALADNGGHTQTMALGSDSAAIDAGNATTCAATVGPASYGAGGFDQRGKPRNDLQCDIGAYEMQMSDGNTTMLTPGATMRTFGPPRAGIQVTAGSTGAVTVTKVANWTTQPGNTIKAWWNITPTNASGWTANLKLCYLDATELNGLVAANLHLWRYSGGAWTDMGRNSASGNCVQANGITGFSRWTLAISQPTAVTLTHLSATTDRRQEWTFWLASVALAVLGGVWFRRRSRQR